MISVWVLGLLLVYLGHHWAEPWMHLKLTLVVVLSALHALLSRWCRDFANDTNARSQRFYRVTNEVPAILMVAVVILVVVKPL